MVGITYLIETLFEVVTLEVVVTITVAGVAATAAFEAIVTAFTATLTAGAVFVDLTTLPFVGS
jgi:hypothetical protein